MSLNLINWLALFSNIRIVGIKERENIIVVYAIVYDRPVEVHIMGDGVGFLKKFIRQNYPSR